MTAVVRVLPRLWDGHRLLRFITGLAMLTLAFTARIEAPPAPPVPLAVVAQAETTQAETTQTTQAETTPVSSSVSEPSAPIITSVAVITAALVLIAGAALRVRAGRAPPLA